MAFPCMTACGFRSHVTMLAGAFRGDVDAPAHGGERRADEPSQATAPSFGGRMIDRIIRFPASPSPVIPVFIRSWSRPEGATPVAAKASTCLDLVAMREADARRRQDPATTGDIRNLRPQVPRGRRAGPVGRRPSSGPSGSAARPFGKGRRSPAQARLPGPPGLILAPASPPARRSQRDIVATRSASSGSRRPSSQARRKSSSAWPRRPSRSSRRPRSNHASAQSGRAAIARS